MQFQARRIILTDATALFDYTSSYKGGQKNKTESLSLKPELSSPTQSVDFLGGGRQPADISHDTWCVHSNTTSPQKAAFIHAFIQLLIVLFGLRPGIIPVSSHQPKSFLSVGSFIFSALNLAVLPEIRVLSLLLFRFGSRTFSGTL